MDKAAREASLNAIDTATRLGPIERRIPAEIEAEAREIYESESKALTGNVWDWTTASDEVRNRFRLKALINFYNAHR